MSARGMLCALAMLAGAAVPAAAQAPRPSAQVPYPGGQQPYQQQPYQQQYQQPQTYQQQRQPNPQELRCMQLEQELANDWTNRQQGGSRLPQIDAEIRKYEDIYRSTQARAENEDCYQSMFIFGRSLVRTPRCMTLHRQIEDARQRLATLQEQRAAVGNNRGDNRKRELIDALARAGCGAQYQQEARRNSGGWFSSLFQEEQSYRRPDLRTSRIEPFATYRTLCVRTCDGYYFPLSYSALPSNFNADINQCQSQCAAPAELFVYRNPGEEPEQMVSADGRMAYNDLPNAWRYRKEYIKGCSCKPAEYDPAEIEMANRKTEDGAGTPGVPGTPSDQVAQDPTQLQPQQLQPPRPLQQ